MVSQRRKKERKWMQNIGLGGYLFVKVPRPGDSEGTFSFFKLWIEEEG